MIAFGIGAALIATGVLRMDSSGNASTNVSTNTDTAATTRASPSGTVGSAPLSLPDTLPGFQDRIQANTAVVATGTMSSDRKKQLIADQRARSDSTTSLTITAYQAANPGAAVSFRQYSDPTLSQNADVIAVRAKYPGLTIGAVTDPADLGLAAPPRQVVGVGDVQCLVEQSQVTPAGSEVPDTAITTMCRRTGPGLTVQVFGGGSFKGSDQQDVIVGLTNDAWAAVAG